MADPAEQKKDLGIVVTSFLSDPTRKDGRVKTFIVDPKLHGDELGFTDDGIPAISPNGLAAFVDNSKVPGP